MIKNRVKVKETSDTKNGGIQNGGITLKNINNWFIYDYER